MPEGDAAFLYAIHELKLVEDLELTDGLTLSARTLGKTFDADIRIGDANPDARCFSAPWPRPFVPPWRAERCSEGESPKQQRPRRGPRGQRGQRRQQPARTAGSSTGSKALPL